MSSYLFASKRPSEFAVNGESDHIVSLRKRFNRRQAEINDLVKDLERELDRLQKKNLSEEFIRLKNDQIDTIVEFHNICEEFIEKLGGGIKVNPPIADTPEKKTPQAIDLEEAVLGGLILEAKGLEVMPILRYWHFYKENHQLIFKSIETLHTHSNPIDMRTVVFQLRKMGHLDLVGGAYYISELTSKVSSAANIEYHSRCLIEMAMKREVARLASLTYAQAFDDTTDVFQLLDTVEKSLASLKNENIKPLN